MANVTLRNVHKTYPGGVEAIKEWVHTKTVWICGKPDTNLPFVMRS